MSSIRSRFVYPAGCLALVSLMHALPLAGAASAPSFSCTNITTSSITLSWYPVTGANNYSFVWAEDSMMTVNRKSGTSWSTSLLMSGLVAGKTYWIQGSTYSSSLGGSGWTVPTSCATAATATLTAPTVTVGATTMSAIPISWTAVTGATSYRLNYSTDSTFATGVNTYSVTSTSYTNSVAMPYGTTYYFRVQALNTSTGQTGPWSATVSGTTQTGINGTAPPPTGVAARGTGAGGLYVSWNGVSGATYKVNFCRDSACKLPELTLQKSVNTTYTSVSCSWGSGVTMYSVVQSCVSGACGPYSAVAGAVCQ